MTSTQKRYTNISIEPVTIEPSMVEGLFGNSSMLPKDVSESIVRFPPSIIYNPQIVGETVIPSTLICTQGTWDGSPKPTFSYQWYADGVVVADATSNTFVTDESYHEVEVTCEITGSSSQGVVVFTTPGLTVYAVEPVNIEEAAYYVITGVPVTYRSVMMTHRFYVVEGQPTDNQLAQNSHDVYVVETVT